MSHHTLKLLSEAYRNVAQAPTQSYAKLGIITDLETLIEKEIEAVKKGIDVPPMQPPSAVDDKIPF